MKYYIRRTNRETGKVWKAFCEEKNGEYDLLKTTAQNGRLLIYLRVNHWAGFNSIQWMLLIHNI